MGGIVERLLRKNLRYLRKKDPLIGHLIIKHLPQDFILRPLQNPSEKLGRLIKVNFSTPLWKRYQKELYVLSVFHTRSLNGKNVGI